MILNFNPNSCFGRLGFEIILYYIFGRVKELKKKKKRGKISSFCHFPISCLGKTEVEKKSGGQAICSAQLHYNLGKVNSLPNRKVKELILSPVSPPSNVDT